MMRAVWTGLLVLIAGCGISVLAQQKPDPFTGTWKLNVAKSTMDMASPMASKSETVVYRHENGEEIFSADAVTAKGEAEHTDYRAKYDGPFGNIRVTLDGKVTSEGQLQLRRLDTRTRLRIAMRDDGTLNGIIVRRLSEDGKSITSSILSFDKTGKIVNTQTRVFEKAD